MKLNTFRCLSGNAASNINGNTVDASQVWSASFHLVPNGGTLAGTFKLQVSNDILTSGYLPQNFVPTNWVDLPNQSASVTGGAPAILTVDTMPYRWIRAVWTASSGTGTAACNVSVVSA